MKYVGIPTAYCEPKLYSNRGTTMKFRSCTATEPESGYATVSGGYLVASDDTESVEYAKKQFNEKSVII
jgi:hypothetical protein